MPCPSAAYILIVATPRDVLAERAAMEDGGDAETGPIGIRSGLVLPVSGESFLHESLARFRGRL